MSDLHEEISALKMLILKLEGVVTAAEKEGKSEAYVVACKNELVETVKEKNILLELSRTGNSTEPLFFSNDYPCNIPSMEV